MLKAFRQLKNKPVHVTFNDENIIGGGISSGQPRMVALFMDIDCLWAAFKWQWSDQIVIVPTSEIACIAGDRKDLS